MPTVADFYATAVDYGFTDSTNATLLRALQGSVDSIERLRPWPFLEASVNLAFSGSSAAPTVAPPRIRAVLRATNIQTGLAIKPLRLDDLEDSVGVNTTQSDLPLVYYMEAGVLKFWPLPPSSTTVRLRYLQFSARLVDASVEADFLIPFRHHEVILFGMLRRLYDQQDDPELAATMAQQRDQMLTEMVEDLTKQQYDEPEYIRQVDPNDYV